MKPSTKEFGGFIKMLRKRADLTVRQLEDKSGVSHSYITQMENGRRGVPSPDVLKKIAEPLQVNYDELLLKAGYLNLDYAYYEPFPVFVGLKPREENLLALYVFGTNILRLRENLGFDIEEVSVALSIDKDLYLKIESGAVEIANETMELIAEYFGENSQKLMYERIYFNEEDEYKFAQISLNIYYKNKTVDSELKDIKDNIKLLSGIDSNDEYSIIKTAERIHDELIVNIPIYGVIKAGYDFVAEQNIIGYKVASKKEVSDGEYFYLIVKGDSMIEEGIRDGFKVLVKKQTFVETGKIGVVIVNGDEATLKRVFYDGGNVILQASNRNISPRVLPIQDVMIQGQVKSVVWDV